jgi:hypothetical protein
MSQKDRGQAFSFSFAVSAVAEAGGVMMDAMHFDVDAICHAYDAIKPVARRLGVAPPHPALAGFCYAPLVGLGAKVVFPKDSEPFVEPMIQSPEEIDGLREPESYLSAELTQKRLALARDLKRRRPDASTSIGHLVEGPVTAAALIYGRQEFFTLPYDDPVRAHRLLEFSVRSMANYARAITEHAGGKMSPRPVGIPDDFAGIFPPSKFAEFVAPYWDKMYQALQATTRSLHSELLRVEHMPYLKQVGIANYDPSADQFLTPPQLRDHCPAAFSLRILSWDVHDRSADELEERYRYLAGFHPSSISFSLARLADESKIDRLLRVAREMSRP